MNFSRLGALVVTAALFSASACPANAGMAEAAPGVNRPDWVIWAVLGVILVFLIAVLLATQGDWRGKGRDKKEGLKPPYF